MARASYANPYAGRARYTPQQTQPPPATGRAYNNQQAASQMQQQQRRQMPDTYMATNANSLNMRAYNWWTNQMKNFQAVAQRRAASVYVAPTGNRENANISLTQGQRGYTGTQMPDRVVPIQKPTSFTTPVSYSTPINVGRQYDQYGNLISSGISPTRLPDSYFAGQRREAENWGNSGRVLPDTLQWQADREMEIRTATRARANAGEGGKSKAPAYADTGGGYGGYGYGGGYSGGGGSYKEQPAEWYANMAQWNYG